MSRVNIFVQPAKKLLRCFPFDTDYLCKIFLILEAGSLAKQIKLPLGTCKYYGSNFYYFRLLIQLPANLPEKKAHTSCSTCHAHVTQMECSRFQGLASYNLVCCRLLGNNSRDRKAVSILFSPFSHCS